MDAQKHNDEMASQAQSMFESVRTPAEKYADALKDIADHAAFLDPETTNRLKNKAATDAFGDQKLSGIVRTGSAESQAARFDAMIGQKNKDGTLGIQKDQLAALNSIHGSLQVIEGNTANNQTTIDDMPELSG
jgi:hypothetical protein